jgi:hypothetical protein
MSPENAHWSKFPEAVSGKHNRENRLKQTMGVKP